MMLLVLAYLAFILAAIPAILFLANLKSYAPPPLFREPTGTEPWVSVLIPARNEASAIRQAVRSALSSRGVNVEVVVLDDRSDDATAAIVADMAPRAMAGSV